MVLLITMLTLLGTVLYSGMTAQGDPGDTVVVFGVS